MKIRKYSTNFIKQNKNFNVFQSILIWGRGDRGQLGMGPYNILQITPTILPVNFSSKIKNVVSGVNHTFIITEKSELYSFGRGDQGQLGNGSLLDKFYPEKINIQCSNEDIKSIKVGCGGHHTICSIESYSGDYRLFGWGRNTNGQLGLGRTSNHPITTPEEILFLKGKPITSISCGEDFSVITSNENIYTFGKGDVGQLGKKINEQCLPTMVEFEGKNTVIDSSCGWGHCLVVTDNSVISWGANKHSQCGRGVKSETIMPGLVNFEKKIDQIVGVSCGSCHSMLLDKNGEVYIFGSSSDGKMQGSACDLLIPTKITFLDKIKQVASGSDHLTALSEKGHLFVWGYGQHGCLGNGELKIKSDVQIVKSPIEGTVISKVVCSMDTTIALISQI